MILKKMKLHIKDIPIFFIVTRPRSGSTLVQSTLDSHLEICATTESRFVINLYSKYHSVN